MSKFKVGDKVTGTINGQIIFGQVETIEEVLFAGYRLKDRPFIWLDSELKLAEPEPDKPKLTNTIITDIKDEAQHKREQTLSEITKESCALLSTPYRVRLMAEMLSNNGTSINDEPSNIKPMSSIVNFFNDLTISAEDKELRKAGLKNEDLSWSYDAKAIVKDLEAKDRGYKNMDEMAKKFNNSDGLSPMECEDLFIKFYAKLLDTAKKFNAKEEKKSKQS